CCCRGLRYVPWHARQNVSWYWPDHGANRPRTCSPAWTRPSCGARRGSIPTPPAIDRDDVARLVERLTDMDEAVILTSFHQSPLPLALLLRLAGVKRISAISDDYPGSLLDLRHRVEQAIPEADRALSLVEAAGFRLG